MEIAITIYLFYLPVYLIFVFFLASKVKSHTTLSHTVSFLASVKKPWNSLFNITTFFYGLLSLIIPLGFMSLFENNIIIFLGSFFVSMTGFATMLVGIFSLNNNPKVHLLVGYLAFLNVIFTGIFFFLISFQNNYLSVATRLISFWVVLITCLLAFFKLKNKKTYPLLEWISFIGTVVWNFVISGSLLMKIWG